jgi:hypothetical protein
MEYEGNAKHQPYKADVIVIAVAGWRTDCVSSCELHRVSTLWTSPMSYYAMTFNDAGRRRYYMRSILISAAGVHLYPKHAKPGHYPPAITLRSFSSGSYNKPRLPLNLNSVSHTATNRIPIMFRQRKINLTR